MSTGHIDPTDDPDGIVGHGKSVAELLHEIEEELGFDHVDVMSLEEEEPTEEDLGTPDAPKKKRVIRIKRSGDTPKAGTKIVIKRPKTVTVGKPTGEKPADGGELVTVKDLSSEFGINPKQARKQLRAMFDEADGRWEWSSGDPKLVKIREHFTKKFGKGG